MIAVPETSGSALQSPSCPFFFLAFRLSGCRFLWVVSAPSPYGCVASLWLDYGALLGLATRDIRFPPPISGLWPTMDFYLLLIDCRPSAAGLLGGFFCILLLGLLLVLFSVCWVESVVLCRAVALPELDSDNGWTVAFWGS